MIDSSFTRQTLQVGQVPAACADEPDLKISILGRIPASHARLASDFEEIPTARCFTRGRDSSLPGYPSPPRAD